MKKLNCYLLILISCAGMNNAVSQNLLASNTGKSSDKNEATSVETEAKAGYKWEFYSIVPDSFDESIIQNAEENNFGQRVACLKTLVEKYYISKEEIVPGHPAMRTMIRKPNIYNTVRKVEKHLKKEVKKGNLSLQQATNELTHVLEVAISAVDEPDTHSFESSLNESKGSVNEQINVFKQVKLNYFY